MKLAEKKNRMENQFIQTVNISLTFCNIQHNYEHKQELLMPENTKTVREKTILQRQSENMKSRQYYT